MLLEIGRLKHRKQKTKKLFDCALIGVCAVIRLNTICYASNEYLHYILS